MLSFRSLTLDNGLRVIIHEDPSSASAVVNIMYDVGSRNEEPNQTGFAHLFEHLMFGSSQHIPSYDEALQQVGGDNNAYTTSDVTNYYCILPAVNLETAFWLESDRMLGLPLDPHRLALQQKVVIEEFKENYLGQPYGDAWLQLCKLAYTQHPYRWPTIGEKISHIENATIEMVKDFSHRFYVPNNAVMVVAGDVRYEAVKRLVEKWFAPIPMGQHHKKTFPKEPTQTLPRTMNITADVPLNAIYKAYHMPGRLAHDYHAVLLMTDLLGGTKSSRLYEQLVNKEHYFSTMEAYMTETVDPGLCVISGHLNDNVSFEVAEEAIQNVIETIQYQPVTASELAKAKNQAEAHQVFSSVSLLYRAQELAMATIMGNTNLVNCELESIHKVMSAAVQRVAQRVLHPNNCSTLYYQRKT